MNSLSNLIGSYTSEYSESEPEDQNDDEHKSKQKSFSAEIGNLLNEINDKNSGSQSSSTKNNSSIINYKELPVTDWTQCLDLNTGHPYYWNITTKDVTWDKPLEYVEYLNKIETLLIKIPDDCWIIGYSDNQVPYYVNEYTRVVSWEKPENFKPKHVIAKKKRGSKLKNSSAAFKKLKEKQENKICVKKKPPEHLFEDTELDVKIELIQSYTTKSSESSESDDDFKKKTNVKVEQPKRNLVAAYSTEEEDSENDTNDKSIQSINPLQKIMCPKDKSIREKISVEDGIKNNSTIGVENYKYQKEISRPNTFASIITGDKPQDQFNDEINKLKEELEKELLSTTCESIDCRNEEDRPLVAENETFVEKNFQRKRRIEFGTNCTTISSASTSKQLSDEHEESSNNTLNENNENNSTIQLLKKKNLYMNFERSHVEFTNEKPGNNVDNTNEKKINENKVSKNEIYELSGLLLDKVRFLNIGHNISPVQVTQIQLETLIAAYNSSALDIDYFLKWLKQIENDLFKLESNAAPDEWMCKWDRKESKYFYENSKTGKIQWEYPNVEQKSHENDININESTEKLDERGEMEMEISTTPPPNENEQIIVKQHLSADGCWDADNAPPPPIISMPSPKQTEEYSINNELASFYSDIATLDTSQSNLEINNSTEIEKKTNNETIVAVKKKRKKMKVQGLGTMMNTKNEVFSMVAKWEKVQKELNQ